MNARPQHPQMNARPQHLQMNARPQRLQMNVGPQCLQMNARPHLIGIFLFEDMTNLPGIFLVRIEPTMLGYTLSETTSHTRIHPW